MKESNIKIFFLLLVGVFLVSCSQKEFDTSEELMVYITDPENGYVQQKEVNGIAFSLLYRPTDLLVQQEISEDATKQEIDSLRKKYNDYVYFNLSMSKNNQEILNGLAGDRAKFGTMVNQLAFGMEEKVHLFSKKKDTIAMADYIYPRMYGMGGGTTILLVYPRSTNIMKDDFFHLTIEDIGLTTGEVGFKIPVKPIKEEPRLVFIK